MADKEAALAEAKRRAQKEPRHPDGKLPPAGPHARPELTDKEKTPDSGVLPEHDEKQTEAPTG
jgi:hypothetical protein